MTCLDDIYRQRCEAWSDVVEHMTVFHDTVVDANARTVVELGVRSGNSTAAFLAALEQTDGQLWSVDIKLPKVPIEFHDCGGWTFVLGDDLDVADQLPDDIDVLFIDSSHHYYHTLAELDLYGARAATILLHDTELEHPDGAPAIDPSFPVRTAATQWCARTGRAWKNLTNCYGLGVIGGGRNG
jgi:predicted O-methyltransferase YrrM